MDRCESCCQCCRFADVSAKAHRFGTAGAQTVNGIVNLLLRATGDGDASVLAGEEFSDTAVDTAGTADNDDGSVREIKSVVHQVAS
jgi:hypothetical protein